MSIQEIIAPVSPDREIGAGQSLALGAVVALVLAIVAQGTMPAQGYEDWHGNVAVSAAR